jgi:hypothetical protein
MPRTESTPPHMLGGCSPSAFTAMNNFTGRHFPTAACAGAGSRDRSDSRAVRSSANMRDAICNHLRTVAHRRRNSHGMGRIGVVSQQRRAPYSRAARRIGLTPVSWSAERLGSGHVALLFRDILWFGPWRSHSFVPTRTMVRLPRTAAVKDGPSLGPPEGLVLDGCEHGGRLVCAGIDCCCMMPPLIIDRGEISDRGGPAAWIVERSSRTPTGPFSECLFIPGIQGSGCGLQSMRWSTKRMVRFSAAH